MKCNKKEELPMVIKVSIPNRFQFKTAPSFKTMLFQREGEVHYIGGADILPAPLDIEEENRMIGMLGTEGEKQAKSELIEHNLRLVVYIAKKFDNTSVGVEDLISIGTIGLIKAINTFNPEKNIKLATYASRCIENEILMYLRRNNKTKMEVSIDEPLNVDWDGNELLLSDILGTDEDVISRDIETETEKSGSQPVKPQGEENRAAAVRAEPGGRGGDDTERGGRPFGDFPVLYIQAGEKDYEAA